MRVLITGGSGFLGHALAIALEAAGHNLVIHSRHPSRHQQRSRLHAEWVGSFEAITHPVDAVVNLAGANLFTLPWTDKRKQKLLN
ncbi:MAG: NAD-dependent epimerase/dehydratase family protein, partial [Natronospirillum sp.]